MCLWTIIRPKEDTRVCLLHVCRQGLSTRYVGRADAIHELLPCTYGYATTVRRAQGASLDYVCLYFDAKFPPDRGYGYVGASRGRNAAGLYHFKRLRRTDRLPIGGGDSDEESDRGDASDAESLDPYDGWQHGDDGSDCNTLRSDGHVEVSSDEDIEPDEDGNFRSIEEDYSKVGQGDLSCTGDAEPQDAYMDLVAFERRRSEGGGVA